MPKNIGGNARESNPPTPLVTRHNGFEVAARAELNQMRVIEIGPLDWTLTRIGGSSAEINLAGLKLTDLANHFVSHHELESPFETPRAWTRTF